jgi:hypothetical protein
MKEKIISKLKYLSIGIDIFIFALCLYYFCASQSYDEWFSLLMVGLLNTFHIYLRLKK